ncbi:Hpt domain-containing protein [Psychrosphaera aestuarii]|uniref:Hpt domain-containing protein n=1 Tax=Psychrosphaera aestuarii TaxID=1266052 RepID=UPI001B331DAF|nr:Hpt domain-containing protein [Psychrosphaera aestuarii]
MNTSFSNTNEPVMSHPILYPEQLHVLQPSLASINELGQPETYLLIIEMFVQQYESFNNEVQQAIKLNNGPELHSLIHTLKGSSGALGLQQLNEISTELDLQLTQKVNVECINFKPLYDCVTASIHDCHRVLELNQGSSPSHGLELTNDGDLSDMLITLREKLHNHELITQPFLNLLVSILDDKNCRKYDQVLDLIKQFEYSKAYQSLIELD